MEKVTDTDWVIKIIAVDYPEGVFAAKNTRRGDRYERRGSWTTEHSVARALTYETEAKARAGGMSFLKSNCGEDIEATHFRLVKIETLERHTEGKDIFPKDTSIIDMVAAQDEEVA